MSNRTTDHRATARARKALAHAVSYRMDQEQAKASKRALRRASRGERHARAAYLESLRLGDLLADLEGGAA